MSQRQTLTLNNYIRLQQNPAAPATSGNASISAFRHAIRVTPVVSATQHYFSFMYPLVKAADNKRWGGIGVHFREANAGDDGKLSRQQVGLSWAQDIRVGQNSHLALGLQNSFVSRSTSFEGFTSANQWVVEEFRFDPSRDLGESFGEQSISYFSLAAGLSWYIQQPLSAFKLAEVSLSLFDLNRPNEGFTEESRVPVGMLFTASGVVYQSARFQVSPKLYVERNQYFNTAHVLLSTRFFFRNTNPFDLIGSGNLELIGRYNTEKDFTLGINVHQENFSMGFSYNIPVTSSSEDRYFRNATAFGVTLRKAIWKPRSKRIVLDRTSNAGFAGNRKISFDQETELPVAQKEATTDIARREVIHEAFDGDDMALIRRNIQKFEGLKYLEFELKKDFKFGFNEAVLNSEARAYLDELAALLNEDERLHLNILGHSDNIGSAMANYRVSSRRATQVFEYLKTSGKVPAERMKTFAMGDKDPLSSNDSDEGRNKNRRVEFIIYIQ